MQRGLVKLSDDDLAAQLESYYFSKKKTKMDKAVAVDTSQGNVDSIPVSKTNKSGECNTFLHPLNALIALKRVCIYPDILIPSATVSDKMSIESTIERFNNDLFIHHKNLFSSNKSDLHHSGKLCQLANVLVESEVLTDESYTGGYPWTVKDCQGESRDVVEDVVSSSEDDDNDEGDLEVSSDSSNSDSEDEDSHHTSNSDHMSESEMAVEDNCNDPANSKKCIIFAEHLHTLDVIEALIFNKLFPTLSYARLDGKISAVVRADVADRFNRGVEGDDGTKSPRVLLLSTGSCGLGLNLSR